MLHCESVDMKFADLSDAAGEYSDSNDGRILICETKTFLIMTKPQMSLQTQELEPPPRALLVTSDVRSHNVR